MPAFRAVSLALALALLGGCTVFLDWSENGLPCDLDNQCLAGYVCSSTNTCVPEAEGACSPACGAYKECFKGQCVPTCKDRPCGAAQHCSEGECVNFNGDRKLGASCDTNDDCESPSFCLRPFGGGTGMCTKVCADSNACGDNAPTCRAFNDGNGDEVKVCAPDAFTSCAQEADCAKADLSCGMFSVTPTKGALMGCRTRVRTGVAIGEACSAAISCANGLCAQVSGNGDMRCLTPCTDASDCDTTLPNDAAKCLPVTVNPRAANALPRTRSALCVPGGQSQLITCEASAGACHADAPDCVAFPNETGKKCAQTCADGSSAVPKCGGTLKCLEATRGNETGNFCGGT